MKKFFVLMLVLSCAAFVPADTLFLHHFDNPGLAYPDRFAADQSVGRGDVAAVYWYVPNQRPAVANYGMLFGEGCLRGEDGYDNTIGLAYHAKDNFSFSKGSVEGFVRLNNDWRNTAFFYIDVTDASGKHEKMWIEGRSDFWEIGFQKYTSATEYVITKVTDTAAFTNNTNWQYVSADWKLDSDIPSENFLRLWVNGFFVGQVSDIEKSEVVIDETEVMGVFARPFSDLTKLSGYGDEFRITNGLISDIYTLDGNDYAVPTSAFTLLGCSDAIGFGYGLPGDMNSDCYVNFADLAEFAQSWLNCVEPTDPLCSAPWN